MIETKRALPRSEHFGLEQLAAGVFAAIGTPGGAAYSNAGIIDLGDQTLVFDTFDTPTAAKDLKAAAEQLTGRPASYVIISHAHADHWCGNQVFARETPIIATYTTREMMPETIGWLEGFKKEPETLVKEIQEEQKRLESEMDPRRRATLERSVGRLRHLLEELPTLEIRYPNWAFDGKLAFHGSGRTAELLTAGVGHTSSDAYLVLPTDGIMFMGDLGFFACQPYMAYCDPQAWTAQLEQMEGSEYEVFVPGHGPLGTKADLALQRQYITVLEESVAQVIKDGGSTQEAVERAQGSLPAPLNAWLHGGMWRYEANVRSSFERQRRKKGGR